MKRVLQLVILICLFCPWATLSAGSLEGMWKLESGYWPHEEGAMVYPGDALTEGSESFRVFTKSHHFFMADAPAMELFKAMMTTYSVDQDQLKIGTTLLGNQGAGLPSEWTISLEGDRLTMELEGNKEVWVRVE
jgi:hypothetical protein